MRNVCLFAVIQLYNLFWIGGMSSGGSAGLGAHELTLLYKSSWKWLSTTGGSWLRHGKFCKVLLKMRMKNLTGVNVPSIYDIATEGSNVPKGKGVSP